MVKLNKRKLRDARPKAFPGEAIVAAGVGAAATIAGAAINAAATKSAAQRQAEAARQAARTQADALGKQNEIATQNQEKQISFIRSQNERNRDLQKEIQMNLQLLTGQQNENERLEATKIQVKHGGSMRKRLRNAKTNNTSSLQGRNGNLAFQVTDGGGVIPLGITPEGYELYELVGNDHNHYHKARGGKQKTGVGIKFADTNDGEFSTLSGEQTNVIEGEGNQNSNLGELMLVTPTDAKFISKHSMHGYNPAKAVLEGEDPVNAFAIQEAIKNVYGISDDGKHNSNSPVRRLRYAGGVNVIPIIPDLSLDYLAPVATGVAVGTRRGNQVKYGKQLRNGGRCKAASGFRFIKPPYPSMNWFNTIGDYDIYRPFGDTQNINWSGTEHNYVVPKSAQADYNIPEPLQANSLPPITRPTFDTDAIAAQHPNATGTRRLTTAQDNLIGAGISSGANLLAAGIGSIGNYISARNLARSYDDAGRILADAYGNLGIIDMNAIDRRSLRSAHAHAVVRTPYVNTLPELTLVDRSLQRRYSAIGSSSLSGAATLNRLSRAETDAYDMRSQIFSAAEKQREAIRQANAERITQVANANADRDVQANRDYTSSYLNLLQYNNDIENERITGAAQARADALSQRASVLANTNSANAQSIADAINVSGNSFANAFATNAKMANELEMSQYGWTAENYLNWVIRNADLAEAKMLYKRYKGKGGQYDTWAEQLENTFGTYNLV